MTLGCGGWGGNITSDNISPKHLINIKRLAYETTPALVRRPAASAGATGAAVARSAPGLPTVARSAEVGGISADTLARRIDEFLGSRGYVPPKGGSHQAETPDASAKGASPPEPKPVLEEKVEKPTDFVCEDDVRQAIRQGRKIVIGERTIVTPAARDIGEQHRVFVQAQWPR
jgi:hypothetical protein